MAANEKVFVKRRFLSHSTVPHPPGAANPYFGTMQHVVSHRDSYNSIGEAIRKFVISKGWKMPLNAEQKRVMDIELQELKKQFMGLVREGIQQPPPRKTMPPPPPPAEVYGRIADEARVVDIGSGNGGKVRRFTGNIKMTLIDPELQPNADVLTVKRVKQPVEEVMPLLEGKIVTSFNVLVNLPDISRILMHDGLHIVPDHESLLNDGVARREDGRVVMLAGNMEYRDYPHFYDCPRYPVKAGYHLLSTLRENNIVLRFRQDLADWKFWPQGEFKPFIDASPASSADFNVDDLGYKWDGVAMQLEVCNNVAYITVRSGQFLQGSVDYEGWDPGEGFCLNVEMVLDKVGHPHLVLLSVLHYRGIRFPHHGDFLRYFASVVRVQVDGVGVCAPPKFQPTIGPSLDGVEVPCDGIISRCMERDYYVKNKWTFDVDVSKLPNLRKELEAEGRKLHYNHPPSPDDTVLAEFEVSKKHEILVLSFLRWRKDKTDSSDAHSLIYLAGLPTLQELAVMYGEVIPIHGLRDFLFS